MMRPTFEARIARARELAEAHAFAAEVLRFYAEVAAFQESVYEELEDSSDPAAVAPSLSRLLSLAQRAGPAELAHAARNLAGRSVTDRARLLHVFWTTRSGADAAETFFAKAALQPWAERLADRAVFDPARHHQSSCPACSGKPVVAVLRPEGHGARRSLVCGLCSTEWPYLRMSCPQCGEQALTGLPVYVAEQFPHMRVDACDRCKTYLKSVDLTRNGLAIPVVDELAALPLDLWAQENGYTKLEVNLLGL